MERTVQIVLLMAALALCAYGVLRTPPEMAAPDGRFADGAGYLVFAPCSMTQFEEVAARMERNGM